jgi:ABC-2 type transport system permease protein
VSAELVTVSRDTEDAVTPAPPREVVIAPSAFGGDFRRLWRLTTTLAVTEFRLRYLGSILGYVWSLLRPLLFFGVIYVVFTQIFKAGTGAHYGVYILCNVILWTFFMEVTGASIQCLVAREGLIRKMRFPRLAIPLSVCMTASFTLAMNLVVVVIFALANGVYPRWTWLEMPIIIALWGVLALGVGMILSILFVRMRDVQPIWDVISQILFYGSPLVYTLSRYSHSARGFVLINPIAALVQQTASAFIDPSYQTAHSVMGSWLDLLEPFGIIVAIVGTGFWLFIKRAPLIAENL